MSREYNLKTILSHLRDIRQITSDGTKSSDFSADERCTSEGDGTPKN